MCGSGGQEALQYSIELHRLDYGTGDAPDMVYSWDAYAGNTGLHDDTGAVRLRRS